MAEAVAVAVPTSMLSSRARKAASAEFDLIVESTLVETPDSRTLLLRPTGDDVVRPFRAGQYLQIAVDINGQTHRRSYSVSGAEGAALQISVKAVVGGTLSHHLVHQASPGDRLRAKGPTGRFVLPNEIPDGTLCFLAAGSGITPIVSMISTILSREPSRPLRLIYATRNEPATMFAESLREMAARHASFELVEVHSQPSTEWLGESGRLTAERATALLRPDADSLVYLCGPADLMTSTRDMLITKGTRSDLIVTESYIRKDHQPPAEPASSKTRPKITWLGSGISDYQRPGETLLAASQRVDADVPYICESGECGSCRVKIIDGTVAHEPDTCLSPAEEQAGYALACSSYAIDDVALEA